MSEHLDLDALADAAAGEPTQEVAAHLLACAQCREALEEVRAAQGPVAAALAGLPATDLPTEVAARISAALATESRTTGTASVTTLPPATARARQWLPAAAAVVLLLAGAGYGISRLGSSGSSGSTSSAGAASAKDSATSLDLVRNDTGTDYTGRATLAAAVPDLLAGTATTEQSRSMLTAPAPAGGQAPLNGAGGSPSAGTLAAAADPLARLRDTAGLADCLLALLPPDDPAVRPLALDYAQFKGAPAMVVVLPSTVPKKLDVFVVGPGCSRANDSTLFYTSVDKP
jgi:hypothetical protein